MTSTRQPNTNGMSLITNKALLQETEKLIQIIPAEMLKKITEAAASAGHSIDVEVSLRLIATFVNPGAFGFSALMDEIMNKKFAESDMRAEREAREKGWMHVYQTEKLRLFVEFEGRLPKKFKESFDLENLQEEIAKIRKELSEKGEAGE